MKLVICEKPSVGAAVAAALGVREKKDGYIEGNGYFISWCIGHLVGLAEAAVYGEQYRKWSYDSLPILPQEWQYTVAADKGKQFKILKDLMHRADVSEVVNACKHEHYRGCRRNDAFEIVFLFHGCDSSFQFFAVGEYGLKHIGGCRRICLFDHRLDFLFVVFHGCFSPLLLKVFAELRDCPAIF